MWYLFTLRIITHAQSFNGNRYKSRCGRAGMLRGRGFLGFFVSCILGCWFLVSNFIGFLVSRFQSFLVSWFQSFEDYLGPWVSGDGFA